MMLVLFASMILGITYGQAVTKGPYSLRSQNYWEYTWGMRGAEAYIDIDGDQFNLVSPGLTGEADTVSFELAAKPGQFLRHYNYLLYLEPKDSPLRNAHIFDVDATFRPRLDKWHPGYVSYESVNYPNHFIRHQSYRLKISLFDNSQLFKDDASFMLPAEVQHLSDDECAVSARTDCGWNGINADICEERGCCWVPGDGPHCFYGSGFGKCAVDMGKKEDCGWPGISKETCEARDCCFRAEHGPHCFRGVDYKAAECAVETRVDCGWAGISATDCRKKGCCYNEEEGPNCFYGVNFDPPQCAVAISEKKDCGWPKISVETCESRGCCYREENGPHCFYNKDYNPDQDVCNIDMEREDCGFSGISDEECQSRHCCVHHKAGDKWCYFGKAQREVDTCAVKFDEMEDCGFPGISEEACYEQGCCWHQTTKSGVPWCFFGQREPENLEYVPRNFELVSLGADCPPHPDEDIRAIDANLEACATLCLEEEQCVGYVYSSYSVDRRSCLLKKKLCENPSENPRPKTAVYSKDVDAVIPEWTCRLAGGPEATEEQMEGLVQCYIDGVWATICSNGVYKKGWALVLCLDLGYDYVVKHRFCKKEEKCQVADDSVPFALQMPSCRPSKVGQLRECQTKTEATCTHEKDAWLTCGKYPADENAVVP